MGWIGVDLDGTLSKGYGNEIGEPVPLMAQRVSTWLKEGFEVRIFTARAGDFKEIPKVMSWLIYHGLTYPDGRVPKVTNIKDYGMICLYDDRAIQVELNTGRIITEVK